MPEHNSKRPSDEAGLGLGFLGLDLNRIYSIGENHLHSD